MWWVRPVPHRPFAHPTTSIGCADGGGATDALALRATLRLKDRLYAMRNEHSIQYMPRPRSASCAQIMRLAQTALELGTDVRSATSHIRAGGSPAVDKIGAVGHASRNPRHCDRRRRISRLAFVRALAQERRRCHLCR